ncbi:hypothetical protein [Neorhizobium galegae]|uniref:hypothetical protein n=1 Tax=Neorhizobium galegae TaxID=399 RepID=UPI000621BBDD|nr:hypothetical protein [Neorhizobium galegae]KAB1126048.1 hypothetical protein F4V90_02715 [Neorhizobium galegae]MCQ1805008.1 hypothetical protein [Neorhizobium galegae]CDZ55756.1 Hypothetical protein NGAL_HAMBI2566_03150 [Neorhizobium galegae bv. orientalis]
MSANSRNAVLVCLGLVIFMTIIPPAMLGSTEGRAWRFIYDYQTLIAGSLAVASAFATIFEMRRSMVQQAQQHQTQLNISTLPSRLAVGRFMASIQPELRNCATHVDSFIAEAMLASAGEWTQATNTKLIGCVMTIQRVADVLKSRQSELGSPLFTARLEENIKIIMASFDLFQIVVPEDQQRIVMIYGDSARPDWLDPVIFPLFEDITAQCNHLADEFEQWAITMLGANWRT